MKSKKITIIAILAMALVMMMACNLVAEVASIDFTNAPKAFYEKGERAPANDLKVKITMKDGTNLEVPLTDSRLTVEGLVDGMLDTATEGTKTLKVTYMGISITVTYVVGQDSVGILWSDSRVTGDGKTLLEDIAKGSFSQTVYDLAGYQWDAPVISGDLTLNPTEQVVINNLTMTTANAFEKAGGFIAVAKGNVNISNIKFVDVTISNVDNGRYENAKNYGVVIGQVDASGKVINISNITVDGLTMLGMGRVAGIVGQVQSAASTTITNCTIKNASISGNNPVKDINGDGEADKLGAIMGQHQNGELTITDCTVTNTTINGTRDLGGLVGYLAVNSGTTIVITDNTLENVTVSASVTGGMLFGTKGFRNIGGLIGTIATSTVTYKEEVLVTDTVTIENNAMTTVTTFENAAYEDVSSTGDFIGGIRMPSKDNSGNSLTNDIFVNGVQYTISNAEYATAHATVIANINKALVEANN